MHLIDRHSCPMASRSFSGMRFQKYPLSSSSQGKNQINKSSHPRNLRCDISSPQLYSSDFFYFILRTPPLLRLDDTFFVLFWFISHAWKKFLLASYWSWLLFSTEHEYPRLTIKIYPHTYLWFVTWSSFFDPSSFLVILSTHTSRFRYVQSMRMLRYCHLW